MRADTRASGLKRASHLAPGEVELVLLATDGDHGEDRDTGLDRGADVAGAAVEVDDVGLVLRAQRVEVAAGEDDGGAPGREHLVGVLPRGRDQAEPAA